MGVTFQFAKLLAKGDILFVAQVLIREKENLVLPEQTLDLLRGFCID